MERQTETQTTQQRRMIGVSLGAETTAVAVAALQEIARSAHIAEIRLDFMAEYDLETLLHDRPCPVIVTNRPEREGGRFRGTEEDRVKPLLQAIELGVEYVDIEHDAAHMIGDTGTTGLVVSYHDFEGMPDDLPGIHDDLAGKGADVVKIAGMAHSLQDNLPVLELMDRAEMPTIAIAMGEAGLVSRVLALRHDSCFLTYATLDQGEAMAPGQLLVSTMRDLYRADRIGTNTKVYGVLSATTVAEELLSWLNDAMDEAGHDGIWVPFVVSSSAESPSDVAKAFRGLAVEGYVVEWSSREEALKAVDDVAQPGPEGRINVIRQIDGRLVGYWIADLPNAFSLITGQQMASP